MSEHEEAGNIHRYYPRKTCASAAQLTESQHLGPVDHGMHENILVQMEASDIIPAEHLILRKYIAVMNDFFMCHPQLSHTHKLEINMSTLESASTNPFTALNIFSRASSSTQSSLSTTLK